MNREKETLASAATSPEKSIRFVNAEDLARALSGEPFGCGQSCFSES
jgi:hypothetical protein